ncbi:MAG TPA: hypothetical protein VD905_01650 [Flavobacteriales bacterium]|nr:hypothetical protein [Flavobacteriales bacterium]
MKRQIKNFEEFKKELAADPVLQQEFKNNPVEAIQRFEQGALSKDVWVYRIVVASLGMAILFIALGVMVLIGTGAIEDDKSVPTLLTAIGSGAIGALAGLLAPQPKAN